MRRSGTDCALYADSRRDDRQQVARQLFAAARAATIETRDVLVFCVTYRTAKGPWRRYDALHDASQTFTRCRTGNLEGIQGMKRTCSWLTYLLVGASISLVWAVTMLNPAHLNWSPWAYSEWLISYDAGFIRRGIGGWLIRLIDGDGADLATVNLVVFANYAMLSLLMVWVWARSRERSPAALALAFLVPGGLFQMAIGNAFFFRKEIVFHVVLGIDCLLYSMIVGLTVMPRRLRAARWLAAFFLVQAVALPLLHESYAFISFPAAWLIARRLAAMFPAQAAFARVVKVSIALQVVMFLICAAFKGNPDIASQLWHMLAPADRSLISPRTPTVPGGGISAIGWSTVFNLSGVAYLLMAGQFWVWAFAGFGIASILVLVTLWNGRGYGLAHEEMLRRHLAQLGFLFVASLPMYLLGIDWGRWLSSVSISYLLLFFVDGPAAITVPQLKHLVPRNVRARIADAFVATPIDVMRGIVASAARHRRALFLLALFFCLTFRAPECCITVGSPFYRLKPMVERILNPVAQGQ
ncbi:hypothetical protein [Paraburkholderia saeva]|uniref:Uncharacterized protein n=1 Tax=Paraburkholderia saeva TaxID=2777537 RepID=A0A9N8RYG0_9BURK|nr:hypothetical protein [Paraburkholderia saeva]CAG4895838.1 hypothetical protein R70241_02082 [Paraburkholderia saeva]CAG4902984.1 hypothetical protein LMG31841_03171 [Paraburkholderia saeva]